MTCLRAAVENGADAVYFGLDCGFNARARAGNFSETELDDALDYLHRRGVRGYVTLNTLTFTSELPELEKVVRRLAAAGVDAVLVQDLGAARLIREICPQLSLHASTQMTLTSAECIEEARWLGLERVVLPRELSIDEIRLLRSGTDMELEVFVHGALCVAYSGQCLTSESLGGRSANRGQCAQACRLPWEIVCDGQLRDFGDQKYLLSPQDLAAYPLLQDLLVAGVRSFKIEGRLKTPEYVAQATSYYREALDSALNGVRLEFPRRRVQELEQSFSRGFSPGWLQGCDHKMLVPATSSAKRGVLLGVVEAVRRGAVAVRLEYPIQAGDGVVFEGDRAAGEEQGGRVYHVAVGGQQQSGMVESGVAELTFESSAIDLHRLQRGQRVWKTDDPRLNQRLRRTFEVADPRRRVGLMLSVTAVTGSRLRVRGLSENGCQCDVESDQVLEAAVRHAASEDLLREQLGRLGGTVFELRGLECELSGTPMIPLSLLGKVRREMLVQLQASLPRPSRMLAAEGAVSRLRSELAQAAGAGIACAERAPQLVLMCRTLQQLEAALQLSAGGNVGGGVDWLLADFQDLREYREAVRLARDAGIPLDLATPRIQKPGETGMFRMLEKAQPDGVLVRNLSGVAWFRERGVAASGDYSLNAANELTALQLKQRGLRWLTPSYDLNRDQLMDLVRLVPGEWLEVVIHQHMPMFHMEHCVFCAMLSPGTNKTNCGRPCDVHVVELRDRMGLAHPLTADIGCRNTLFNAVAQSSAEIVPELLQAGVRRFRIELLRETPGELAELVRLYRALLAGNAQGEHVWRSLQAMNRVGVTRGTLEPPRNPLAIL
jgi:putative protease